MENTISGTNFSFPNQKGLYKGKVRDVYEADRPRMAAPQLALFQLALGRLHHGDQRAQRG